MKKILLVGMALIGLVNLKAQSGTAAANRISAMVYALPKIELCFDIELETSVEKPGLFYLYSQRYLATNQVVKEDKLVSKIKSIALRVRAIPDPDRRFAIDYLPKSSSSAIVVNEQGILCGINIPVASADQPIRHTSKNFEEGSSTPELLPLTQEYMMAGSIAKMAEGAAIQIYKLRESRLNLLSGEVDHLPDGNALKIMLAGLDRKEKELTELFVGSIKKKTTFHTLSFVPEHPVSEEVLFRLSATRGIVGKDDLGGEPFFITISPEKIQLPNDNSKGKHENAQLYTVLPATTTVTVSNGVDNILHHTLQIPQFGELVALPQSLLREPGISVTVDPQTGRLLGIKK